MRGVDATTGRVQEPCTVMLFRTGKDDVLLRRARGEYREMPALRLTIEQAMRLWDLDRQTCLRMLNSLVASQYLDIDGSGRYRRAHCG